MLYSEIASHGTHVCIFFESSNKTKHKISLNEYHRQETFWERVTLIPEKFLSMIFLQKHWHVPHSGIILCYQ